MMNNCCFCQLDARPIQKTTQKISFFTFYRKKSATRDTQSTQTRKQQASASNHQGAIGWGYLGEEPYRFSPLWLSSRVKTSTVNDTPRCAR